MKKLLLLAAVMLGGMTVYGQGYILVANATSTAVTNAETHGRAPTGMQVGAYYSPNASDSSLSGSAFASQIHALGAPLTALQAPGIMLGKGVAFAGTNPGDTVAVQLRAWSTGFATYEDAAASPGALVGFSQPFQVKLGGSTTPTLLSGLWPAFTVSAVPVPEPSVLLLGALGLFGGFLIRRRK